MPVFGAGLSLAHSLAAVLGVPCYETTHQEGHIMAALHSIGAEWKEPFLALHLSGGTGELLAVEPRQNGFDLRIVGDTDLPPGQFIDRVGVAMGLPFPAGPCVEQLAEQAGSSGFRLSGSVKGTHVSFSGPESAAQRALASGVDKAEVAAAVLDNIAKSLGKAISTAREEQNIYPVLIAGGVAANKRIRARLSSLHVHFSDPRYAGDNSCGVALLGRQMHLSAVNAAE